MFKLFLYKCVEIMTRVHNKILTINDNRNWNLSDKELHIIVIGILGMILTLIFFPLFNYLVKKDHPTTITFIYVFTLVVGITFAIEIGQGITKTGSLQFGDIVAGLFGFVAMFAVFAVFKIWHKYFKKK